MAHQPLLRPDPSLRPRRVDDLASAETPEEELRDAGLYLSQLAATLAAHGGGPTSADLALDLVLNEIVEQARLATTATGAAIALVRGEEIVCRATTGESAPDLGVRLTMHSGLSGACVQSREVQRCDDTETDPRVDTEVCRRLDVRSILIVPLLDEGELAGVFEIFSPRPQAFGDRDVQTVQALSRRIIDSIHRADEATAPEELAGEMTEPSDVVAGPVEFQTPASARAPRFGFEDELEDLPAARHDYWTDALSALIVALTLLLGWMLGRASWRSSFSVSRPVPVAVSAPTSPEPPAPAATSPPPAAQGTSPGPSATTASSTRAGNENIEPAGGLVVYEKGKVVFRMTPAGKVTPAPAGGEESGQLAGASTRSSADSGPLVVPPEVASELLIHRVEPQYPEEARQEHIQGDVVLQALIGKDGVVRELKLISGDSRLASAAMDAVRQWRFKPYPHNGQSAEVQTQISVNFTLP
jgi:TonB family protein